MPLPLAPSLLHRRLAAPLAALFACATPTLVGGQVAVIGNTVEEHVAAPGESYTGSIVVRNMTTEAQPVRIYQTDYSFSADGTSSFDAAGSTPRSNAKWITLSTTQVVVPPSGDANVAYTVTVPQDASLRGTYWSTVMVEGASTAAPSPTGRRQVGLGVVMRYAVQLATHLQATGTRKLTFPTHKLTADSGGGRALELSFENVGERAYRPLLWIEVYDAQGALRLTAKQQRGLLYPGTSGVQKFALNALPPGTYKAVVFADIGNDEVLAAQYRLEF